MTASTGDPTAGAGSRRLDRILLATDLSGATAAATDEAFQLASRLGATLLIVSVIDPGSLHGPAGRFGSRVDQIRSHREAAATDLVARGRRVGVEVTFLIWEGDPGESIVEAAAAERADLVVVGSHGRSGVGRAIVGSVSDHVVRHAPCPVLVVRPTT
jgi:nucleotide-binding universal stress UspA family protein